MAINFDQDRGSLLGINNNNINSNQMAFLPDFLKNFFLGDPESIQLGEEGSPIDKAKDALEENKQKSLPSAEDVLKGNISSLGLPSDNLTAMATTNYNNLFQPETMTDASKFNIIDDGITKNIRFRDMILEDLKNLPRNFKQSLGTTKDALTNLVSPLTNKGINLSGKGLLFRGIGSALAGPVGSFIGGALANLKETPEQKAMRNFYKQNFGLDDIGRIESGIMKGYNPVYGFGGAGLQGAIDKRLATILRTEENKKKKGLKLSEELLNRRRELEALKERDRIAKLGANQRIGGFDPKGPTQRSIRASREDRSGATGTRAGGFTNPGRGSYGPYS